MDRKTIQDQVDEINRQIKGPAITDMSAEEIHGAKLSSRQILALRAFHKGAMIHEVAKLAGVSRQTLHRWRTRVPEFAQAMNSWESAVLCIARSRMAEMAFSALDALSDAIDQGDVRSATALLRSLGLLKTYRPVKSPEESETAASQPTASKPSTVKQAETGTSEPVGRMNKMRDGNSRTSRSSSAPGTPAGGPTSKPSSEVKPAPEPMPLQAPVSRPTQVHRAKENKPSHAEPLKTRSTSKPAILAINAGLMIKNACDGALHRLTKGYQRLTQCDLRLTQCDENWTAGYIRLT